MSVQEKVGQLFIVSFVGNDTGPEADITTLITQYKVGGVVLQASNSNFRNHSQTPQEIAYLANALQAYTLANKNIPLFIAIDHEGDAWPYTRITGGVTPIPSALSIGATWNLQNAYDIGTIVGRELASMGINLLLGPVLDVLNEPRPGGKGDIGIRTFGGDPFWAAEMGRAYIQGVHEGSNSMIATVAKHFPGHGGSDRLPDDEVATVDKSLRELRRIELAPFFAVTNHRDKEQTKSTSFNDTSSLTDAMMSSHIRYRGLQGDIRQFTAPISFDQQGMATLLQLPEFTTWRDNGGLIISDALGVLAVRKHYDPTLQTFPHRQIAREAFLAGNDILMLGQFALSSVWADQFENIKDTIEFFQNQYQIDHEFRTQVDQSVRRILRLKLNLFPNPSPNALFVDGDVALFVSGEGQEIVNRVARESLTLLYPTLDEYQRRLPRAPTLNEKILIVSDVRRVRECFEVDCTLFEPLLYNAIETVILKYYGPAATSQVSPENIASMSFAELKQVLVGSFVQANQSPISLENRSTNFRAPETVTTLIQEADWIIFATLDSDSRFSNSNALKLFLENGFNQLNKKIIVLALNSPYHLDTTEINKLTAYLGVYSKTEPHLEIAIRALFGEAEFLGASPITVEGVSYHLPDILSPDPIRALPLQVRDVSPASNQAPIAVTIEAGPILDHNGHIVPDGTPVELIIRYQDGQLVNMPTFHTFQGRTETTVRLFEPGVIEIMAQSGAAQSQRPQIISIAPPSTSAPNSPTATSLLTPTATNTLLKSPTPTSAIKLTANTPPSSSTTAFFGLSFSAPRQDMTGNDFLTAILGIMVASTVTIYAWRLSRTTLSDRLRLILVALIGGLIGYLLYGIGWLRPDVWFMQNASAMIQRFILSILVIVFGVVGNLIAWQFNR